MTVNHYISLRSLLIIYGQHLDDCQQLPAVDWRQPTVDDVNKTSFFCSSGGLLHAARGNRRLLWTRSYAY